MLIGIRSGILSILFFLAISFGLQAQEEVAKKRKFSVGMGADFVSSYVWRGLYQGGASIQPGMTMNVGNFSLTAWDSTDFRGMGTEENPASKEIDLELSYELGDTGLEFFVSDYWWIDKGSGKFFNYKSSETDHAIEAGISYAIPLDKFPLSIAWYTFFYGADKKENGKQNYSSYLELTYPFKVKDIDLEASFGMSPYASGYYETSKCGVTNVALKASSSIPLSSKFELPVFVQAVWNPYSEDVHLLLGLSLSFGDY